jgi:hypothetical protein
LDGVITSDGSQGNRQTLKLTVNSDKECVAQQENNKPSTASLLPTILKATVGR